VGDLGEEGGGGRLIPGAEGRRGESGRNARDSRGKKEWYITISIRFSSSEREERGGHVLWVRSSNSSGRQETAEGWWREREGVFSDPLSHFPPPRFLLAVEKDGSYCDELDWRRVHSSPPRKALTERRRKTLGVDKSGRMQIAVCCSRSLSNGLGL
jgi:hypothetical protein